MSYVRTLSTSDDRIVENADWAELSALLAADGNTSQEDLARAYHQTHSVSQQTSRDHAKEVFRELADRAVSCGNSEGRRYPFEVSHDNLLLSRVDDHNHQRFIVYRFLLMVTLGDMSSTGRTLSGVDATKVFERLCSDVLRSFWGVHGESGTLIVGTSASNGGRSSFKDTIEGLCSSLAEGDGWKTGARAPRGGDGGLDVAVWRRFSDKREGGLVGFAQCKTGENWRRGRTQLQPRAFCRDYMVEPIVVDPIRIYMVPHRIMRSRWRSDTGYAGLMFDRCRIAEFASSVSSDNLRNAKRWLTELIDLIKAE